MTERVDLAKAVCDLRSAILGMQIAHGQNPMAASILSRHADTIEAASKIALGFDDASRPEARRNALNPAAAWPFPQKRSAVAPTELQVQAGAVILATTPTIDAPKLSHNEWMGLSRAILEAAFAVSPRGPIQEKP